MMSAALRAARARAAREVEHFRTRSSRRGLILLYHGVAAPQSDPWRMAVRPENFAAHMAVLRRRGEALPRSALTRRIYEPGAADRCIAVTFDDGYLDNLRTALPILEREQIPATLYVISGAVGRPDAFWWDFLNRVFLETPRLPQTLTLEGGGASRSWDLGKAATYDDHALARAAAWTADQERPRDARQAAFLAVWSFVVALCPEEQRHAVAALAEWSGVPPIPPEADLARPLARAELEAMAKSPLIEIGGHTVSHRDLSQTEPRRAAEEIRQGREALVAMTGKEVSSFAYPFGRFGPETAHQIAAAGYADGGCSRFGLATRRANRFRMPRVQVPDMDGRAFERMLRQLLG